LKKLRRKVVENAFSLPVCGCQLTVKSDSVMKKIPGPGEKQHIAPFTAGKKNPEPYYRK